MNAQDLVSVVVPAHNAAGSIGAQLEALHRQQVGGRSVEIVVVDNASTDDTAAIVTAWSARDPRIRLVSAPAGRGPSYARNIGIAAARGTFIACCDADDVVAVGWLDAIVTALDDHPYVGGPLEVDRLNADWLANGRGRWGVNAPGRFGNVAFAHGCNLGIHRDAFRSVGGFDERLHAGEEIDLALRLVAKGVPLTFVPDAVIHYRFRPTLPANFKQSYSFGKVAPFLERRAASITGYDPEGATLHRIMWLLPNVPRLSSKAGRVRWTWVAAGLCGRAVGKVRSLAS